jgi:hypothetical protein
MAPLEFYDFGFSHSLGRIQPYKLLKFMKEEQQLIPAKQTLSKLKYQRCLGLESAKQKFNRA